MRKSRAVETNKDIREADRKRWNEKGDRSVHNRQKRNAEPKTINRQQSPAHSSSVSPGTFLSDIWVYIPQTTSHTICVAMLAEAAPLTESHSIYLSPPYLLSKTIQAWRRRGGAEGRLRGRD